MYLNVVIFFISLFSAGAFNETERHELAHNRLSEVLGILKQILSKYPHLHSPDILDAAKNIIRRIRDYDYSSTEQVPEDYYSAIDHLALSFSSRFVISLIIIKSVKIH